MAIELSRQQEPEEEEKEEVKLSEPAEEIVIVEEGEESDSQEGADDDKIASPIIASAQRENLHAEMVVQLAQKHKFKEGMNSFFEHKEGPSPQTPQKKRQKQ